MRHRGPNTLKPPSSSGVSGERHRSSASQTAVAHPVAAAPAITRRQIWLDVISPFAATRLALLVVGLLASYVQPSPEYPLKDVLARGWHFSPVRALDIWARWDTGWYMSIIRHGYMLQADFTRRETNLTFFPLYPMIVRGLVWPIPDPWNTDGVVLAVGIVVSNLCLVGGLLLLYLLAQRLTGDTGVAQRTVLYLLFFPTGFFLSCVYTEALFLLLSVAALYAAQQGRWGWAAVAGALLGLTRPLGVLMMPVLLWLYLSGARWRVRDVRADVLWVLLIPVPFLLYLAWMGSATGDWLAPLHAQRAFFGGFAWPWTTLLSAVHPYTIVTVLEKFFVVFFLLVSVLACWRLPSAAYGLWGLALIVPAISTATPRSALRYILVTVPVYIVLAQWGRSAVVDRLVQTLFFAIQIALMVAWSAFYFIA